MLEKLRRSRAIGKQHDAGGQLPLVKMGGSFSEFFDSVRKETIGGTRLPNWSVLPASAGGVADVETGAASCTSSYT